MLPSVVDRSFKMNVNEKNSIALIRNNTAVVNCRNAPNTRYDTVSPRITFTQNDERKVKLVYENELNLATPSYETDLKESIFSRMQGTPNTLDID